MTIKVSSENMAARRIDNIISVANPVGRTYPVVGGRVVKMCVCTVY